MKVSPIAFLVAMALAASVCSQTQEEGSSATGDVTSAVVASGIQQALPVTELNISGASRALGHLPAELLQLHRTEFKTPEARQEAIRQWFTTNSDDFTKASFPGHSQHLTSPLRFRSGSSPKLT